MYGLKTHSWWISGKCVKTEINNQSINQWINQSIWLCVNSNTSLVDSGSSGLTSFSSFTGFSWQTGNSVSPLRSWHSIHTWQTWNSQWCNYHLTCDLSLMIQLFYLINDLYVNDVIIRPDYKPRLVIIKDCILIRVWLKLFSYLAVREDLEKERRKIMYITGSRRCSSSYYWNCLWGKKLTSKTNSFSGVTDV